MRLLYIPVILIALVSCTSQQQDQKTSLMSSGIENDSINTETTSAQSDKVIMFKEEGIRATGNEPFWMVEVRSDSVFFNALGGSEFSAPLPQPEINDADSLRYSMTVPDGRMNVLFINSPCVDNMSGFKKKFTTQVSLTRYGKEDTYHGCADYISEYNNKIMEGE